jgi:hypothetical protein
MILNYSQQRLIPQTSAQFFHRSFHFLKKRKKFKLFYIVVYSKKINKFFGNKINFPNTIIQFFFTIALVFYLL